MHGKKDQEHIRKGPWKAEEDEVLLNHVKKYGPRDWSSIRSKGLLQRTGKSCRLRWVNKLRPNLKNGCKFSLEEERVVIELQAQFGNKWAKIASYLPGRTDNDVKNFWSSRQKRLARILQTSATTSKSQKNKTKVPTVLDVPTSEAPKFSSSSEGEPSSKPQSCSLSCIENSDVIKMVPLPDLIKFEMHSSDTNHVEQEFTPFDSYNKSTEQITFPQISELNTDVTFSMGNQDLLARIDEPNFIDVFDPLVASEFGIGPQHSIGFPFFEPSGSCRIGTRDTIDNSKNSHSFFDDFPVDIFDDPMEPPASPSNV
ncbi:transcription factor DUO1 [Gastrolobium bilobum]|uniref:transcription factor DUO1 n=1 Tax=Gastrolobium bilobum TaxID=150636 RepID=UPI002AB026A6|nr:transcription factor DUO1 [Gastrolobium bilobum]